MKQTFTVRTMAEVAVFAAIGYVLDLLAGVYSAPLFINGGSIGIAMLCVFIVAYRRGTLAGVLVGAIMGILDIADGFYVIAATWYYALAQVFLDYLIAYPLAGLAGLFRKLAIKKDSDKIKISWIIIGCSVAGLLKFVSHYLSGVLFWNDPSGFAPWGISNGYLYSLVYNMAYMLPCIVICTLLMVLIAKKWPMILKDPTSSFAFKRNPAGDKKEMEGKGDEKN